MKRLKKKQQQQIIYLRQKQNVHPKQTKNHRPVMIILILK